ncbi:MAG: hypothetical protein JJT87_21770 [Halomonas sp.]|nr:hypothetical protein [Halomonas sp.]MCC5904547.1 hypothetical protein [Halomonas sp.]
MRSWAEKVIEELSEASYGLASSEFTTSERNLRVRKISTLIEIGRFYLPNQQPGQHGTDKPVAYRGFRHAALDPLVAAVRLLQSGLGESVDESLVMWELRREFVSILFNILGPEHHNNMIGHMIRESHRSRSKDPTVGGLLPDGNEIPTGATSVLHSAVERVKSGRVISKPDFSRHES